MLEFLYLSWMLSYVVWVFRVMWQLYGEKMWSQYVWEGVLILCMVVYVTHIQEVIQIEGMGLCDVLAWRTLIDTANVPGTTRKCRMLKRLISAVNSKRRKEQNCGCRAGRRILFYAYQSRR